MLESRKQLYDLALSKGYHNFDSSLLDYSESDPDFDKWDLEMCLLKRWLRLKHNIYLESEQHPYGDTNWTVVDSHGNILIPKEAEMYYMGYPIENHIAEFSGLPNVLYDALKLIKEDK